MSVAVFNRDKSAPIGMIPRAARVSLQLPLIFTSAEGQVSGHSANVSDSGVLGVFRGGIEIWLTGQLAILLPQRRKILAEVRVVRVEDRSGERSNDPSNDRSEDRSDERSIAMSFLKLAPPDLAMLRSMIARAAQQEDADAGPWAP